MVVKPVRYGSVLGIKVIFSIPLGVGIIKISTDILALSNIFQSRKALQY